MDIGTFMQTVLCHPELGYYTTRDPLGATGDFTTAPEISQIFGEMIGLWAADVWMKMGAPPHVLLAECGPGRGTLMADALRAARKIPPFAQALRVHLIETSPTLRAHQARALADADPVWHGGLEDLPAGPLILIGNEFLDALPVRQFERAAKGWAERCVGAGTDGSFFFEAVPVGAGALRDLRLADTTFAQGTVVERAPAREAFVETLAARLREEGGAALFLDYGSARSGTGDTLQAVRAHRPVPVLEDIGQADLTAHVDFEALAHGAARGGATVGPIVDQGMFLHALGGQARLAALCRVNPSQADDLRAGYERLSATHAMGRLFKAWSLWHGLTAPPEGFS
jgi:NADH dehydrogenase [ubiquinone] 1 alpha subcomplex assembly factor 7